MTNKERIDALLSDIRHLESLVAGQKEEKPFSAAFFDETFELAQNIERGLHILANEQLEKFDKRIEELRALIQSIPPTQPAVSEEPNIPTTPPVAESVPTTEPIQSTDTVTESPVEVPPARTAPVEAPQEKLALLDIRKLLSLNDLFRFRREIFGGDEERMYQVINTLNDIASYDSAIAYLTRQLQWNPEEEAVADFIQIVEKRFL